MLSPSLFTLHNKGLKGLERDLSVPNLLKGAHFTGRDQQEWLNLIMEASGVNDQVESLKVEQFKVNAEQRQEILIFRTFYRRIRATMNWLKGWDNGTSASSKDCI